MATVTIDNLRKEYGSIVAVNDISLNAEDGELVVLVGPSGCGKTTALRSVAGLESPTGGSIEFDGMNVTDRDPQSRDVSMVFQDLALYPNMTARDNISFPLRAEDGHSDEEINGSVEEIAEVVDCEEFLDNRVVELSGGQQQRVALARALIRQPEVFLMDEPFSDLDELLKRQLRAEVARLQQEFGVTMLHVTHDQEEAMTLGDRLVVMNNGNIVQIADPQTVFNKPDTLFVARFIGSPQINEFHCDLTREDDRAVLSGDSIEFTLTGANANHLEAAESDVITVCIRPQHLTWSIEEPDTDFAIAATSEVVEKIGTEDIIRARTDDDEEITAEVESGTVSENDVGYFLFEVDDLHLFDGATDEAPRLN